MNFPQAPSAKPLRPVDLSPAIVEELKRRPVMPPAFFRQPAAKLTRRPRLISAIKA